MKSGLPAASSSASPGSMMGASPLAWRKRRARITSYNVCYTKLLRGKAGLLSFFVGQVMKETRGKANPRVVQEVLKAKLG